MTRDKDVVSLAAVRGDAGRLDGDNARALQQAARRLAEGARNASGFRTKDLVGLLLSHGARTWRNSFPPAVVRLRVFAPNGKPAIKIRLD